MPVNSLITLLFALLLFSIKPKAQPLAKTGTRLSEFRKQYPPDKESKYNNTVTLEFPGTVYMLESVWGYRFTDSLLDWVFFHKYIPELNSSNFSNCLLTAGSLINDYAKFYGRPDTIITGDTTFRDPYEKRHWGYDVLEARWNNAGGMKIKVEFTFMGGKGEYNFLFSVNFFDKDYPYFD